MFDFFFMFYYAHIGTSKVFLSTEPLIQHIIYLYPNKIL